MSETFAAPARSRPAWKWATLADVGKVITGNTPPTADAGNYGDAIPFVKPTELVDRGIRSAPSGLAPQALGKARVVPAGAVLVSCIGNLGKTGIAKVPVAFNQQINAVVFNENVVPEFGFYYAQTLQPWLYGESSATTIPIVNKGKFQQARFPLASLEEQREIVAELEKQFSRLDDAVANLQRVKANLKRYKVSVLKAAVEGRLVETEASLARREGRTYETGEQLLQRILGERKAGWDGRSRFKLPISPEAAELSEVPQGWAWASIDQLAAPGNRAITDGPFGSNLKSAHYVSAGPRVIRLQNIKDGEFEDAYAHITLEHFESLRKHEVFSGDIVIASLGDNPPRACIIPASVGPAIVKADCIRFKPNSALAQGYLIAALNCQPTRVRVKDILHGIGRPRLSLGEIRAIALPIPPAAEQARIVAEVDRHLSIIRGVEAEVDANLQRAHALRQAVLASGFEG